MLSALSDLIGRLPPVFDSSVGQLVITLGVVIAAFTFALAVVILLRRTLARLGLEVRAASRIGNGVRLVLGPERAARADVDAIGRRILFWALLILVVAGFASLVDFSRVGGASGTLLAQLMALTIQVGRALVLLLVAWFLAAVLRRAVRVALEVAAIASGEEREQDRAPAQLSRVIPETVYWIVLLLFLPQILAALNLQGVLFPVEALVEDVIRFLPDVFGALVIFAVGWLVARVARAVVANLLASMGLDRAAERFGASRYLGSRRLSSLVGVVAYLLVLFPVILTGLDRLRLDVITGPASQVLGRVLGALPLVVVAAALLLTAYVVGRIVADVVRDVLHQAGFDHVLTRLGLATDVTDDDTTASGIVRVVVLAVIMLVASMEAASLVGFDNAASLLARLLEFSGQFLLGVVFLGFGIWLAGIAGRAIAASTIPHARFVSIAARVGILLFTTAIGLRQMGIANEIIELGFGLVLGAISVAFAVAFGLGGRDAAARQIERWRGRLLEED